VTAAGPLRLAGIILLGVAACGSPLDEGPSHELRGSWRYVATQVSPAAELTGTLTVTRQRGVTFEAELEAQERDRQGTLRTLSGIVAGRTVGPDGVDFDAFFDLSARRHVGRLEGDSIAGTWAEVDVVTRTGTFTAWRQP
jgi:hypothetical protein